MSPVPRSKKPVKKVNIKAKNTNVVKLQKEINAITKAMKKTYETHHLYGSFTNGGVSLPYAFVNLSNWNTLAPCYGTVASDYNLLNRFFSKKFELDMYFVYSNEPNNTTMSLYIVSLKKDTNVYNKSTGGLSLTLNADYIDNIAFSGYSQALLNPKVFNIHWKKRIILGNNNVAIGAPTGTGAGDVKNAYRVYAKVNTKKMITNPEGNVQALTCSQDPTHQYYLLVMNDNIGTDLEYPGYNILLHHEIETAN